MENIIETENITFSYSEERGKQNPALDGVSVSVREGEYVAILGHNGSGKSTLAKLLNMILVPDSGVIRIGSDEITSPNFSEDDMFRVRRNVGMVFQNPDNQLVATVVEEDVAFGPENLGIPREEIRQRVDAALEAVGMTEYAKHAPHRLSGGQKQRIAIAGIMAMMPRCVIFDEATAMLDPAGRRGILAIMDSLNHEHSITVLNITHHMDEAARADRVIVINDGVVYMQGTPAEVFARVDELHAVGLEAPQDTELIELLRRMGLPLPAGCVGFNACVDALARLYEGGAR
ncbi:MAG: energy-coupling factor transporter ATPase [Clostridia bacterium]|nr:energy-coupling factor transporter ATPase [Clostridia bacterium]